MSQSTTFEIGVDALGIHARNGVTAEEVMTGARKAWRKFGATHFADTTLAGMQVLVENDVPAAQLLGFLQAAMAENDKIQGGASAHA